jgi:hypothetical protein
MSSRTTNSEIKHHSHGVPLETYELTQRDPRDQKTAEGIRDAVKEQAAKWEAEEAADADLRDARSRTVERGRPMLFTLRKSNARS